MKARREQKRRQKTLLIFRPISNRQYKRHIVSLSFSLSLSLRLSKRVQTINRRDRWTLFRNREQTFYRYIRVASIKFMPRNYFARTFVPFSLHALFCSIDRCARALCTYLRSRLCWTRVTCSFDTDISRCKTFGISVIISAIYICDKCNRSRDQRWQR